MPPDRTPLDVEGMESRMDAIRLKQMLGGALTDQELMCLQFEQHGFGNPAVLPRSGTRLSSPPPPVDPEK